ncbi:MAG: hypothetical protein QRY72_00320 [Candidatus Rhabdochlamydia sp.]
MRIIKILGGYCHNSTSPYFNRSQEIIKYLVHITFALSLIYTLGRLFLYIYRFHLPPPTPPTPSITGILPPRPYASAQPLTPRFVPSSPQTLFQTQLQTLIPKIHGEGMIMRNRMQENVDFANYFYCTILRGDLIQDGLIQGSNFSFNYQSPLIIPLKKIPNKILELLSLQQLEQKQHCFDPYSCKIELDKELTGTILATEQELKFEFNPEGASFFDDSVLIGHLSTLIIPYHEKSPISLTITYALAGVWPDRAPITLNFSPQEMIVIFDYNLSSFHYI